MTGRLSFPTPASQFVSLLGITQVKFHLMEFEQSFGTEEGQTGRARLAWPKWTAEIQTAEVKLVGARRQRAMMRRIGKFQEFDVTNPEALYPASDPKGTILGNTVVTLSSIGSDNKTVRLANLPDNYVIGWGDMMTIQWAGRVQLVEFCEDFQANGAGLTPVVEINPPLRSGVTTANATVRLRAPFARMVMMDMDPGMSHDIMSDGLSFRAMESF